MAPGADTAVLSRIAFEAVWAGVPLTVPDALDRAGWMQHRLRSAVDQLLGAGRIELEGSDIIGAHGVTLRATPHRIRHDGIETHTWCAFDAIGIPAGLAIDASVLSGCPACGRQLEIAIHAGVPADDPYLIWMPVAPCENVMSDFCPAANLFCSREHVAVWRQRAGLPEGAALPLTEIAEHGRRAWADVARVLINSKIGNDGARRHGEC
jgi:Alkylmercury lyase